jgi:ABC-type multidrug transport system fused ATPase/permease subunit
MELSAESANPDTLFSIELTNGMQSIKDLYFIEGRGSIFSYKHTKTVLLATLIFVLLSGLFYLLSYSDKIVWIFLFCMAVMIVVICLFIFSIRAKKYFRWKKWVNAYLKELSKYEKQYLNLNSHSFEVVNEDETVIEKWNNIRKVSISHTHITLNSETGALYLLPAKSMEASKYEELKEFIRQRMKDPAIIEE